MTSRLGWSLCAVGLVLMALAQYRRSTQLARVEQQLSTLSAAMPRAKGAAAMAPLPADAISLDGATIKGSRDAKVAILEYSDFQCPYCGAFVRSTLPQIETAYL